MYSLIKNSNYDFLGARKTKCNTDQFQCKSGVSTQKGFTGPCIPSEWENDGTEDCSDGSDERPSKYPTTTTSTTTTTTKGATTMKVESTYQLLKEVGYVGMYLK